MDTDHRTNQITAEKVAEADRMDFFPTYLPGLFLLFENTVYSFASNHSVDYKGGLWEFVTLSNGGMFIYPVGETPFNVNCWGNHYQGTMSPEAFGIGLCLHAFSHLSLVKQGNPLLPKRFEQLYEFAANHAEAGEIFSFID